MSADAAAGRVSQFVLQRLGKSFHACLRHIVGGIAGRGSDALLRAGVDDEAWPPAPDHAGRENLRSMKHAPKIHAENALPVLQGVEHLAARLNARVVHQDIGAAESLSHGLFQYRDVFDPADVSGHGHDVGSAARRNRRYPGFGFGETVGAQIGDTDFHPKTSEPHGSGKAYTGRASCDNGDVVRRHGGVRHLSSPDAKELPSLNIELCRCGAPATPETAWEVFFTAICSPRCRLLRAGRTGYISRSRNR